MSETFAPDLQTGTGNLTIPISVPLGRNGMQPRLDLVYSTGRGNGPFGLGWDLVIPGVSRKTSVGVPTYRDADTFILSGTEDLVPVEQLPDSATRYRPRTEGLFARIVRHGHDDRGDGSMPTASDYWEVTGKDGVTSRYGTARPQRASATWLDPAVTADPENPHHIFAWALTRTVDPLGNVVEYDYEFDEGIRDGHRWRHPTLRRIRYADYVASDGVVRFLASIVLKSEPRPDPFSAYTAGFEIRTSRRYSALQTFVHPGADQPVRRYEFGYDQDHHNGVSLLTSVTAVGFGDDGSEHRHLPPVRLGYRRLEPTRRRFLPVTGPDPPGVSLARNDHELVDLTGDGLPDVLRLDGVARYWRNLGGGVFDRPRSMAAAPGGLSLTDPGVQLLDAQGDGRADLSVTTAAMGGFFPLRFGPSWGRLRRYRDVPSTGLKDPAVQLLDLTGNGVTDAVLLGTRLECLFQDSDNGWDGPQPARFAADRAGPPPQLTPGDPRVRWADMTGDGLQDLVLAHNGSVEYFPNLGHGRWGPRIRMRAAPRLPASFDPQRLLLGDLDGDGLADLAYAADAQVTVWFNRSGNAWSAPVTFPGVPEGAWDIRLTDLLGSGTNGVLFSRDTLGRGVGRYAMYFLDLSGGMTPRLLTEVDNQLGAVTRVEYASSTGLAVEDAARPSTRWRTPLPFPVPVVVRVETIDAVSGSKLTTTFRYGHGYWDGHEREFRGFGRVDQTDSETFDAYHGQGLNPGAAFAPVDRVSFSPPVLTRTWFHLGPVETDAEDAWDELDLSGEFWAGDPQLLDHGQAVGAFLRDVRGTNGEPDRAARRDALRALRGRVLRTELYALDGSTRQHRPYTVTEHAYTLREEPSLRRHGRPRVFLGLQTAERVTQWERGKDPLTRFSFLGDHDSFGQPRQRTEVAMPRRSARRQPVTAAVVGTVDVDVESVLATHARTSYAAAATSEGPHDRVAQVRSYELASPPTVTESDASDVRAVLFDQAGVARRVLDTFGALAQADVRLIGHVLHHYDGLPFTGLALGQVGEHGLLTRSETLVFTDRVLTDAYAELRPQALGGRDLPPAGAPAGALGGLGYRKETAGPVYVDGWYADTVSHAHDVQLSTPAAPIPRRGQVLVLRDPHGHETHITPDSFWLLPARVRDAAGLETTATHDYRAGRPRQVTDPNGTTTTVTYHSTGLVADIVVVGADGRGDTLDRPGISYQYDLASFATDGRPVSVRTRRRVWYASDGVSDEVVETREYSDGFGRLLQTRSQADELSFGSDGADIGLLPDGGAGPAVGEREPDRVVVSGWQVYDNKSRVVEAYQPFFSSGWDPQPAAESQTGRREVRRYDPRGQQVRVLHPDGSQRLVVYGTPSRLDEPDTAEPTPWAATAYDENDLAPVSTRPDGSPLAAAAPAEQHFTPTTTVIDALGRPVCVLVRGGHQPDSYHLTRTTHDIRGNVLTVADEMGRTAFLHAYDFANRALRTESLDAGTQMSVPDAAGNLILARDARGALAVSIYDVLDRPLAMYARDLPTATLTLRSRITYGDALSAGAEREAATAARALGRVWVHDDEAGRVTIEGYDMLGRTTGETRRVISDRALAAGWEPNWSVSNADAALDTETFTTRSSYDALGRAIEIVSPSGQRLVPEYARSGALRAVTIDGRPYVELIARNARGQRVLIAYGNGTMTRYAYDPDTFRLSRLRTERATVAGDAWTGTGPPLQNYDYEYDAVGNCTELTERTPRCGVSATPAGRDALVRTFAYDGFYRLTSATGRACATIAEVRPLDDLPRCGAVGVAYTGGPASPSQANAPYVTTTYVERYRYDDAGNLLDLVYHATSGPVTATWHRLFGVSGKDPGDSAGARDDRLTSVRNPGASPVELHRDEAGNLTGEGRSRTYRWDHAGRLVGFTVQNGTGVQARYLYDSNGMRVKKWVRVGGVATGDQSRVYLGGLAERHQWTADGGGQSDVLHVLDGSTLVATVRTGDRHPDDLGPPVRYELGDHLGSASLTVDDTGAWTNREEYFPYGETSFGSFARKRYRFNGMERDEESGLAYHGARYYAPALARWVSVDPAGPIDGLNRYLAFRANPLTYVDPSGRDSDQSGTILSDTPAASPAPLTQSPVAGFTGEPQAPTAGLVENAGTGSPVTADRGGRRPEPAASTTRSVSQRDAGYKYDLPLLPPLPTQFVITPEDEQRVAREKGPQMYAGGPSYSETDPFLRQMERTGQFKAIDIVLVPVLAAPVAADTLAYLTTKQAVTAGLTSVTFNLVNQASHHGTDWDSYNLRSLPIDYVFGAFGNGFVRHTLGVYPAFSRNLITGSMTFSVENFASQQITIFSYMYVSGAARADILGTDRSSNVKANLISTTGGAAQSLLLQWFLASKTGVTLFPEGQADPRVMMGNSLVGMLRGAVVSSIYDVNAPAKQPRR